MLDRKVLPKLLADRTPRLADAPVRLYILAPTYIAGLVVEVPAVSGIGAHSLPFVNAAAFTASTTLAN